MIKAMRLKEKTLCLIEGAKSVFSDFINSDALSEAGNLTLTSLLAIVPVVSVFLSLFSALPFFDTLMKPAQDLVFSHFVPATGEVVQKYIITFSQSASAMPTYSFILLFVTSLMLLNSIASSINKTWKIKKQRSLSNSLMLYWSILSIGPIFFGLSFGSSIYLFSTQYFKGYGVNILLNILPFLFSWIGLLFLYFVIPNKKLRLGPSLISSFSAALVIEIAKKSFLYIFPDQNSYQIIYGALAVIPLFIIWLYWLWCIVLLGSVLSYVLHTAEGGKKSKNLNPYEQLLIWLVQLDSCLAQGMRHRKKNLSFNINPAFNISKDELLLKAENKMLIQKNSEDNYFLSKKLSNITFAELQTCILGDSMSFNPDKLKAITSINHSELKTLMKSPCFCQQKISDIVYS